MLFRSDAAVGAAFLALLWPRLNANNLRIIAISSSLLALLLIPFVKPGIPVLASVVIAIFVGYKTKRDK